MNKYEFEAVLQCPNYMPMGMCYRPCPLRENGMCEFKFSEFKQYIKENLLSAQEVKVIEDKEKEYSYV